MFASWDAGSWRDVYSPPMEEQKCLAREKMLVSVSVVTPSFNQGRFLRRTIESVLGQGLPLEYFVVDGGSTDGTRDILTDFGTRLRWVSEKDQGQADAVNKGICGTSGDLVGWLNSDDVYYPGAVLAACDYFDANPGVDVLYGDADHIDEVDSVMEPYPVEDWCYDRLLGRCFICQPAAFIRRRTLDKFGMLDEKLQYSLDYEFWIRLAQEGAVFGRLRRVLAGSRLHADTKTLGSRLKVHTEINDMLRERLGRVPDQWIYNYAHVLLDERGLARDDPQFPLAVAGQALNASLRWNRNVSAEMRRTLRQWTGGGIQGLLKKFVTV